MTRLVGIINSDQFDIENWKVEKSAQVTEEGFVKRVWHKYLCGMDSKRGFLHCHKLISVLKRLY